MYSNKKPIFEQSVKEIENTFSNAISIIVNNNTITKDVKFLCYMSDFFMYISINIIRAYGRNDEMIYYIFKKVSTKYICEALEKGKQDMNTFNKYFQTEMKDMSQQAYDNNYEISGYINTYIKSFMYFIGAENDEKGIILMKSIIEDWKLLMDYQA